MNTDTLSGGREITLHFHGAPSKEIKVEQIRVTKYKKVFPLMDDEIALAKFIAGLDESEMETITQESFALLNKTVKEVNKGFFAFADQLQEKAQAQLAAMTPEQRTAIMKMVPQLSSAPSPTSPPPRT